MRAVLVAGLIVMTASACGSGSGGDPAESAPATQPESTPAPASSEASSPPPSDPSPSDPPASEPAASEPASQSLFPGRTVRQSEDSVIASRASYGKGWPWKTSDVVLACSDAVGGGAYLNAANGENYLLTGTITRPGFVKGNAGTELWNGKDGDAYAQWLDAGETLCPDAG
ncbi:hypothetical protein [Streptomyces zinciresistens]|uniref:hypothetical protein n=1 Tax=Streptomyces zinciresistens TaxID=1073330 RepID=UPI00142F3053|nr:hypothetical protein [Streptomyces zinciresistens]